MHVSTICSRIYSQVDGLARQLSKNSEQSMKQYSEILQALAARPISPAPINVPEAPIGSIFSIFILLVKSKDLTLFQKLHVQLPTHKIHSQR